LTAIISGALAVSQAVGAPTAEASAKTWIFATYNIAEGWYGGHTMIINGQSTVVETEPSIAVTNRWAFEDGVGKRRSTAVATRFDDDQGFPVAGYPDVVFVQEAQQTRDVYEDGTLGPHVQKLDARVGQLSSDTIHFVRKPSGDSNSYKSGHSLDYVTISNGGGTPTRDAGTASHIYYDNVKLREIYSGTLLGQEVINASYKASYLQALGTTYSSSNDIKSDKIFPWAYLLSNGASQDQPNRHMVVASVHSTVLTGYQSATQAQADFYNGEIVRGVSNALNSVETRAPGGLMVIGGDMNSWYRQGTVTPVGLSSRTYKSPPQLLSDMTSVNWIDTRAWAQTSACPAFSASNCDTYYTLQTASHNTIDYIFVGYTSGSVTRRGLVTVADSAKMSDHRMVVAQVTFGY
jgi:hypothetical protein